MMPRACPVEIHVGCYREKQIRPCLKSQDVALGNSQYGPR
jgi:hypothetical protein